MPGFAIGPIASVIEKIIGLVFDEDQLPEIIKRRKLKSLKEECRRALADNDFVALAVATARLRDFSAKP